MRDGHHLKRTRVNKIADENTRLITKHFVGGVTATAHGRAVDHVVVEEGGRVNELNKCRSLDVRAAFMAAGAAGRLYDSMRS